MIAQVKSILATQYDTRLVDKLIESYGRMKKNFYMGKHRPSELEVGPFAEALRRMIQQSETGRFTPLGKSLPPFTNQELQRLEGSTSLHDSFRFHIPRALKALYNLRNKRGVVHLSGEVDPNYMDSLFVVSASDWLLAELVRMYSGLPAKEAQALVHRITDRRLPLVQVIEGFPKILEPNLSIPERLRVHLYLTGDDGASVQELLQWTKPAKKSAVLKAIRRLDASADIHYDVTAQRCWITNKGLRYVEGNIPFALD